MERRRFLQGTIAAGLALALRPAWAERSDTYEQLAALERAHGGRLGVAALDTGTGRHVAYRGGERFLMCSTFKLLLAAMVLARCDRGAEQLDRRIVFGPQALLSYAPVTCQHAGPPGMTVAALCGAAITLSDNSAANLLLATVGGPAGVTAFVRGLGDPVTRLDRTEPTLNDGAPGDLRDTTTPQAMLATVHTLLLGDALRAPSRERLLAWMKACRTGDHQLRAGFPAGWIVGDKTGSGVHGESNDVAIARPPRRPPLLVTAYYAPAAGGDDETSHAVLAAVGRIVASL